MKNGDMDTKGKNVPNPGEAKSKIPTPGEVPDLPKQENIPPL
jgi:hypothetical protein